MVWLSLAFTLSSLMIQADARAAIERAIGAAIGAQQPEAVWSETTRPNFSVDTICFTGPDTAMVDVTIARYGALVMVGKTRMEFVMLRGTEACQIASVRPLVSYLSPGVSK